MFRRAFFTLMIQSRFWDMLRVLNRNIQRSHSPFMSSIVLAIRDFGSLISGLILSDESNTFVYTLRIVHMISKDIPNRFIHYRFIQSLSRYLNQNEFLAGWLSITMWDILLRTKEEFEIIPINI